MKSELIELDNYQIHFKLDGDTYIIKRDDLEKKYKLYWFVGNLYTVILKKVIKDIEWLNKFKV